MQIQFTDLIKNKYSHLSDTNKFISKQVLEHVDELPDYSVQQFATLAHVSPGTVVKFAKALGFSGFDELKYSAKYSSATQGKYVDTIANTLALVNEKNDSEFTRIAEMIHAHNNITVFSRSNSANSAFDFYYKFMRIRPNCAFFRETNEQINALMNLQKNDLLFLVSNSGNAKELIEVCQRVTTRMINPGNIILITNNPKAKLREFAGITLVGVQNEQDSEFAQYIPFSAKYSLMFMLDSIFFSYFNMYRVECTEKLNQWRLHLDKNSDPAPWS